MTRFALFDNTSDKQTSLTPYAARIKVDSTEALFDASGREHH